MNLDQKFLELRSDMYKRRETFIKMSNKHSNGKCNCKKTGKICIYNNTSKINLSKLGCEQYIIKNIEAIEAMYSFFQSVTQSLKSTAGKDFESCLSIILLGEKIKFDSQVFISTDGKMYKIKPKNKNGHKIDFIVPPPPHYPFSLDKYKGTIVSCKTTTRERVLQDLYLGDFTLITLDKFSHKNVTVIQIKENGTELTEWIKNIKMKYKQQ
jgi:hypothetical protein